MLIEFIIPSSFGYGLLMHVRVSEAGSLWILGFGPRFVRCAPLRCTRFLSLSEGGRFEFAPANSNSLAPPQTIYPMGGMIRFLCAFQIGTEKISPSDVLIIEQIGLQGR